MREKGIDLRLGLDVVRMARKGELDVAAIFSQNQDLAEVHAKSAKSRDPRNSGSRLSRRFQLAREQPRTGESRLRTGYA